MRRFLVRGRDGEIKRQMPNEMRNLLTAVAHRHLTFAGIHAQVFQSALERL